jgi:uncharacterized protein (UPF0333 family)
MQVDQKFVIITISILIFLSMLGLSMRVVYPEGLSTVLVKSGTLFENDLDVAENIESDRRPVLSFLNLTHIPAQSQATLSFLLLVPVGLLITAMAGSVVGIRTFGTFSPTLLALSQARSDWRIGTVIFIITFGLGSLCRMLLMRFRLSTMPRRGVIGTFVVSALVVTISISHSYGLAPTARHVLLPVAVMTIMIDRFFTIMQTEGNSTALKVLANSIAVAVCCFLVFTYTRMGQFLLRFPEFELLIMALLILIGRYSGQSLLNILGFRGNGNIEQKATE